MDYRDDHLRRGIVRQCLACPDNVEPNVSAKVIRPKNAAIGPSPLAALLICALMTLVEEAGLNYSKA
jgi:hypothetical protein